MTLFEHIRRRAREKLRAAQLWKGTLDIATAARLPHEYIVCPHCGAQDWRLPPHGFAEPCPMVMATAEAFGLKFDAERMFTVRAGLHLEKMREIMEHEEEEEDG